MKTVCRVIPGFVAMYWLLLIMHALLRYQAWKWMVQ